MACADVPCGSDRAAYRVGNIAAAVSAAVGETETGLAAVYSGRLNGHRTASGARYNPNALTAAHQTLPFGTKVKVTFPLSPPPLPIPTTGEGEGGSLSILQATAGLHVSLSTVRVDR